MTYARCVKCGQPSQTNTNYCATHEPVRAWKNGSTRQHRKNRGYVLVRDNFTCHICGKPGATEADHIIPLSEGGRDHPSNMAAAHGTSSRGYPACNQRKGGKGLNSGKPASAPQPLSIPLPRA